jgi:ABC-2 type transport system permease protein
LPAGTATAREWESRTIKEVLLAPLPHELIIVGKVLACFTVTFALGLLVLALGAALDWTRPAANEWLPAVLIIALVALLGTGLGVAVGAALQRIQAAIPVGLLLAIYLFFLAGGIGVLAFEPAWLQAIAVYDPLSYGVHGLQMAVFYASNDQFGLDVLVLSLTSLAALALGGLAVRRQIAG